MKPLKKIVNNVKEFDQIDGVIDNLKINLPLLNDYEKSIYLDALLRTFILPLEEKGLNHFLQHLLRNKSNFSDSEFNLICDTAAHQKADSFIFTEEKIENINENTIFYYEQPNHLAWLTNEFSISEKLIHLTTPVIALMKKLGQNEIKDKNRSYILYDNDKTRDGWKCLIFNDTNLFGSEAELQNISYETIEEYYKSVKLFNKLYKTKIDSRNSNYFESSIIFYSKMAYETIQRLIFMLNENPLEDRNELVNIFIKTILKTALIESKEIDIQELYIVYVIIQVMASIIPAFGKVEFQKFPEDYLRRRV